QARRVLARRRQRLDAQAGALLHDLHRAVEGALALALRSLDADRRALDGGAHALRQRDCALADARLMDRRLCRARHHHTSQSSSPPTLRSRACLSVISPCDVERIAMPIPLWTFGIES